MTPVAWDTTKIAGQVGFAYDPRTGTKVETGLVWLATIAVIIVDFSAKLGIAPLPITGDITNSPGATVLANYLAAKFIGFHGTP